MNEYLVEGFLNGIRVASRFFAQTEIGAQHQAREHWGRNFNLQKVTRL